MNLKSKVLRFGSKASTALLSRLRNPLQADYERLLTAIIERGFPAAIHFDYQQLRADALSFVDTMQVGDFQYRYASSTMAPTLYCSVYACLLKSLFGELRETSEAQRRAWSSFFDDHQSAEDGLFRDGALSNGLFEDTDWWGARHLVLHMIAAYSALGQRPRHRFVFLDKYKRVDEIQRWLSSHDWASRTAYSDDIDNKLMNIVCALQYERDHRDDREAGRAVEIIKDMLARQLNRATGLWGAFDTSDPPDLSRAVQFAYHLYPIYFYDRCPVEEQNQLIDLVLKTQNPLGGFGTAANSSACEDIDSIYMLCALSLRSTYRRKEIERALLRGLAWVFANQNQDGGFVFRRNEPLAYGHALMSSRKNESAMFPTWFRILAIAQIATRLRLADFVFTEAPGLQFWCAADPTTSASS